MENYVQVNFRDARSGEYSGINYTYIADVPVAVGDIVTVPTAKGEGEARVCRVNVSESELPRWLTPDKVRHITTPATSGDMFAEFFN